MEATPVGKTGLMRRMVVRVRALARAAGDFSSTRPYLAMTLVVVFATVAVSALPAPARAGDVLDSLLGGAAAAFVGPTVAMIQALLYMIVQLLLQLNLLLTNILINFAKYNTFVNARPVQLGWPLVRDVTNMFFIVVLLLIAFATIVGYEPFHYKAHLPKLLLMAVLINFSKTLVGIMIDFSQVIMLTFVNGFQAAAFGNFAKAFSFDSILTVNAQMLEKVTSGEVGEALQTLGKVIIAMLFAIGILTVTATVLLIFVIYLIARIVLLWLLLIFSPIAFFALALPGKLQKALDAFVGKWWSDLGSLLSGGPIVAFFLWLTLATIQGASEPFAGMYSTAPPEQESQIITELGSPKNITTMIVAVAMLLAGLNTAVAVSKQASPKLGEIATRIKGAGGPAVVAARLGARATGAAAKGAFRVADMKYNITGKLGAGLTAQGQRAAAGGGTFGRIAGAAMARGGARVSAIGAERRAVTAGELEKRYKHLPPAQRIQALRAEMAGGMGVTANPELAAIATMKYGQAMAHPSAVKAREKELEAGYLASLPENQRNTVEGKAAAKGYAVGYAKRDAASALAGAIKSADEHGDTELADKLKETQAKDPSLYQDMGSLARVAGNKIDDYAQAFKDVKTEAWGDSATFLAYMKASGLTQQDPQTQRTRLVDGYQDSDAWKELVEKGGNRAKYVQAHAKNLESDGGQASAFVQLAAMNEAATEAQKAAAANARYNVTMSPDGEHMVYANMAPGGGGRVDVVPMTEIRGGRVEIQNIGDLLRGLPGPLQTGVQQALQQAGLTGAALETFARTFNRPMNQQQAQHVQQNAAVYANPPTPPAVGPLTQQMQSQFDTLRRGMSLGIQPPPQVRERVIQHSLESAGSPQMDVRMQGASAIANIDVQAMQTNPQVQEAVVNALSDRVDALAEAYKASKNNPEIMKKMEGMVKEVSKAAAAAAAKGAAGPLSDIENKLAKIGQDIKENAVLKKIAERKGRTART